MKERIRAYAFYGDPPLTSVLMICPECGKDFNALTHGMSKKGGIVSSIGDVETGLFKCPFCQAKIDGMANTFVWVTA